MKRFLLLLTLVLMCSSVFSGVAEAKRLGGGMSFGKQRAVPTRQAERPTQATPAPAAPAPNRWLGPLAGLAIGAGLASLFAGGGFGAMGGMLGSILLAVLVASLLMMIISRFKKPQVAASPYANNRMAFETAAPAAGYNAGAAYAPAASNIPADFPVDSFLRNGKTSFIRLQAANDRKDLDDIREYTTPEMFAEIAMQIQERDNNPQKTDVVSINAELLEVANDGNFVIASVRFSGVLRENNGVAENFDEIWHVQRDARDAKSVWLLAGVQQLQ